jgi:hypothetical protein
MYSLTVYPVAGCLQRWQALDENGEEVAESIWDPGLDTNDDAPDRQIPPTA